VSVVVSIVMPMKNGEDYVYAAIDSILNQDFTDFELIVVDDDSTDSSVVIVKSFVDKRISLISGKGKGAADAFNLALSVAKGKYIANCDADDLFPANRLSWQVDFLDENSEYAAVCGTYSTMNANGKVLSQFDCGQNAEGLSDELLDGRVRTSFCTFLTRYDVLTELGGYRNYFISSYDIDLQLRMSADFQVFYQPVNSYFYRLHDTSITHTQASNKRQFFDDTARLFQQQRLKKGVDELQAGEAPAVPAFEDSASHSKEQIAGILMSEAWRLHRSGNKLKAIQAGARLTVYKPFSLNTWKSLVALILK